MDSPTNPRLDCDKKTIKNEDEKKTVVKIDS